LNNYGFTGDGITISLMSTPTVQCSQLREVTQQRRWKPRKFS